MRPSPRTPDAMQRGGPGNDWVLRCLTVIVMGLLAAPPALAHGYGKGDLQVRHPWTRATPPGVKVAAAYLELRNSGKEPDRLLGAATPAAQRVELHVQEREGDVVRMREVRSLEIPARQRLALRAGGAHLMLVGLKKPLAVGERIPMTIHLERAGEVDIEVEVQSADSKRPHH